MVKISTWQYFFWRFFMYWEGQNTFSDEYI